MTAIKAGGRGTPVLLIHGFLDEGDLWRDVAERLAAAGDAPSYMDLPGMGARSHDPGPFTLDRMAAAVAAELDLIGAPAVLVGHSMGAQLAELVALIRPDQVLGLVLISPVQLGGLPLPDEIADAMRAMGGNAKAQRELRQQFAAAPSEGLLDDLVLVGLKPRPEAVVAVFEAWSGGHDAGRNPTAFAGPVAIIGGEQDSFSTPELVQSVIAPRFSQATTAFVPKAGHWPHIEQAPAIAGLIGRFIANLPSKAGASAGEKP